MYHQEGLSGFDRATGSGREILFGDQTYRNIYIQRCPYLNRNSTISQFPQCTCPISHNTRQWNRNVHIWDRCTVGFVRLAYREDFVLFHRSLVKWLHAHALRGMSWSCLWDAQNIPYSRDIYFTRDDLNMAWGPYNQWRVHKMTHVDKNVNLW